MTDIVKKAPIRDAVEPMNVGAEFYQEVDEHVKEFLERAADRAEANGRKTLKARDA